jgi:DNA adenine methylase
MTEERILASAQPFGSPGGKTYLAPRIVEYLPKHKIYVEPFVGGGAVFYRKYPSEVEVLNDKDQDIIFMNRFIRDMTKEDFEKLKRKNWVSNRETFNRLKDSKPDNEIEKFHKLMYVKNFSFAKAMTSYNPASEGKTANIDKIKKTHERLDNVKLNSGDYMKMIDKYDSPDTLFYIDPPYPNRVIAGQKTFEGFTNDNLIELVDRLKTIKGKFILSLGTESTPYIPKSWNVKRVMVMRHIPTGKQEGNWGQTKQFEILASKQEIKPRNFSNVVVGQATEERRVKDKRHRIRQWGESAKKIIGG